MTRLGFLWLWMTLAILLPMRISAGDIPLDLLTTKTHHLTLNKTETTWEIKTTGDDPFVSTKALATPINIQATPIVTFDYISVDGCDNLEVFAAPPWGQGHTIDIAMPAREGWSPISIDLRSNALIRENKNITQLRFDFGSRPGIAVQLRNLRLRAANAAEQRSLDDIARAQQTERDHDQRLRSYLAATFPGSITRIDATNDALHIVGQAPATSNLYLAEWPIWQTHDATMHFAQVWPLSGTQVNMTIPRRTDDGYDRLFSRFVLITRNGDHDQFQSHAHWADVIPAATTLPKMTPKSKKGIGGFSLGRKKDSDLDDLGIGCLTYNFSLAQWIQPQPTPDCDQISSGEKTWYIRRSVAENCDATMLAAAQRGIVMLGIILVPPATHWSAKDLGALLQHPDFEAGGIYTMPNLTTRTSTMAYIALLDYIAKRYSRADGKYGRVHHWIMHNEVDMGYVWTNCGKKSSCALMDAYQKSMRIGQLLLRQQDPNASAFISLTHHWTSTADPQRCHPSATLLQHLLDYSHAEGNYAWGIAYHPYPSSLREPKTWLDKDATFSFSTKKITFHNIEVLDAWVRQPHVLFNGQVRLVHLSEQGPNSPDYSDTSLQEQAASMAYLWQKIKRLDSIQGFEFHNWIDNRQEGGLRIGLRRFPDDEKDPAGAKPVWHLYKALDTPDELRASAFALPIIGITDWRQAIHTGEIR